jgi:hypothetical protein
MLDRLKHFSHPFLAGLLGVMATVTPGGADTCEPPDYSAATVNLPSPPCRCSASQLAEWDRINRLPHGLEGTVPLDSPLDHYVARADLVHAWKPIFPAKTIMCGHVDHSHYHGVEGDWNLFVVPTPGTQSSDDFLSARALMDPDNLGDLLICGSGKVECLEVESAPYVGPHGISPVETWFDPSPKTDVCAYAPFVQDLFHGAKPESHPADLLWWRTEVGGPLYLMALEDGDRFGSRANFHPPPPSTWHPWAEDPRRAQFRKTFKVASGPAKTVVLDEVEYFQVETARHLPPPDPHKTHALESNGAVRLTVTKQFEPKRLKVSFGDVCATSAGDLQGYVILETAVGRPEHISAVNEFWRGYHVLRLTESAVAVAPAAPRSASFHQPRSEAENGMGVNVVTQASPVARPEPVTSSRSLWVSLLRGAGEGAAVDDSVPQPERLLRIREWRIVALPRTEEAGAHAFERLMRHPVTATWSFEARNLVTGKRVAVTTPGSRDAAEPTVRVALSALEGVQDAQAEVSFPEDTGDALYELAVSIVAKAGKETSPPARRRVWSHVVPREYGVTLLERMLGGKGLLDVQSVETAADSVIERRMREGDAVFRAEWLLASALREPGPTFLSANGIGRLLRLVRIVKAAKAERGDR